MPTLMVHLQLGRSNEKLIRLARELAAKWDAVVIGVAVYRRPIAPGQDLDVTGIDAAKGDLQEQLQDAEREFHDSLEASEIKIEWRPAVTSDAISSYLVEQARATDLFIGAIEQASDAARRANIDDVIIGLGRPALLMPSSVDTVDLSKVLVGWTDTRESRRAIFDALPILRQARYISVCEVVSKYDNEVAGANLGDVVEWLKRNEIVAEPTPMILHGDHASELLTAASDQGAGVIVVGAYGHSTLRERVLGGVTKELLERSQTCLSLSH